MAHVVTKSARQGVRKWSGNGRRMTALKRFAHRAERRERRIWLHLVTEGREDLLSVCPERVRVTSWETS